MSLDSIDIYDKPVLSMISMHLGDQVVSDCTSLSDSLLATDDGAMMMFAEKVIEANSSERRSNASEWKVWTGEWRRKREKTEK